MKRNAFDEEQDAAASPGRRPDEAPCSKCRADTQRALLALYGAQCWTCYRAWTGEQQPKSDVGDKRKGPKEWAFALKRREEAGERLPQASRAMWRAALGDVRMLSDLAADRAAP